MEKKTLGRGLEDISRIFFSTSEEGEEKRISPGFSSVNIRQDTCESCINIVGNPFEEPRCKIFTFQCEKYGVPHMDMIILNHAKYCHFFTPYPSTKTGRIIESKDEYADYFEDNSEVQETVIRRKTISYPHTETGQESVRKALFKYLEEAYTIRRIELRKSEVVSEPRRKRRRDEEVVIIVKDIQSIDT